MRLMRLKFRMEILFNLVLGELKLQFFSNINIVNANSNHVLHQSRVSCNEDNLWTILFILYQELSRCL